MSANVGNRILSLFENRSLGLQLTEFQSGDRAHNLHALAKIDFSQHYYVETLLKKVAVSGFLVAAITEILRVL
jgi:hypothetical protein